MSERRLYETHCHTPLCKHAVGEPEEYVEVAYRRRLRGITFTCHNPMPEGFSPHVRMAVGELEQYIAMVRRAQEAWSGTMDVRLGIECDYLAGFESWLEEQLGATDYSYVLGSVHPQTREFRDRHWTGDPLEYQRRYFGELANAAETGFFDTISHPDLVKNEVESTWSPDAILDDIRRALDRIAATGVAMELNTSGANKVVPEMNPFPRMLGEMNSRSIPVVIGADAHEPSRVADRFEDALDLLEEVGYRRVSYVLDRRRHDVSIEEARRSLSGD